MKTFEMVDTRLFKSSLIYGELCFNRENIARLQPFITAGFEGKKLEYYEGGIWFELSSIINWDLTFLLDKLLKNMLRIKEAENVTI